MIPFQLSFFTIELGLYFSLSHGFSYFSLVCKRFTRLSRHPDPTKIASHCSTYWCDISMAHKKKHFIIVYPKSVISVLRQIHIFCSVTVTVECSQGGSGPRDWMGLVPPQSPFSSWEICFLYWIASFRRPASFLFLASPLRPHGVPGT